MTDLPRLAVLGAGHSGPVIARIPRLRELFPRPDEAT